MDNRVAWLDLEHRRSWINEFCNDTLVHEAELMLAAAEPVIQSFDWSMLDQRVDLACDLLYKTIWYYAIQMVLKPRIAWDPDQFVKDLRLQIKWGAPWIVTWYDATQPVAAELNSRLHWSWILQRQMIETWTNLLKDNAVATMELRSYLDLSHAAIPPADLDCVIEVLMAREPHGQPIPLRLTYRLRTDDEIVVGKSGVVIKWR